MALGGLFALIPARRRAASVQPAAVPAGSVAAQG
jgi:hypothetical protein